GTTTFEDLKLYRTDDANQIYAYGNSVSLNSCSFYKYDSSKTECYAPRIATNRYTSDGDITNAQTIEYNSAGIAEGKLWLPTDNYSQHGYTKDVNIKLNHSQIGGANAFQIRFGGEHVNNTTSTFQKNLNIDVVNAAKVNFTNGGSNQKVAVNGGLQVITNLTTLFNGTAGNAYAALNAVSTINDATKSKIWVINIAAANRDKIDFTSTAGRFSVGGTQNTKATLKSDSTKVYRGIPGSNIGMPAGDYDISYYSEITASDYNVNADAGTDIKDFVAAKNACMSYDSNYQNWAFYNSQFMESVRTYLLDD
ncbi:MAG: hypothetical protein IK086_00390, partial [Clostridia bacterium]|nr:hypothetical protein [Clostridia bacterium]